ncbi:MAG: NAD(P)-dependent oxidoreductase [Spirochaetia bacterium]|jgi:nucleoside-diphosphate-sugar epimerase
MAGFAGIEELEERLSEPTAGAVAALKDIPGDIVILGAGGKMGPTLARMAKRASEQAGTRRRVIAVSRFTQPLLVSRLTAAGVEPISCDLLNEEEVSLLPDAPNVIYMAGTKFGTTGNEPQTWAMNAFLPGFACRKYRRSRFVAFSSGNVYGLTPVASGGSKESDAPSPTGEYAWSVLARERMFQYFSAALGIPVVIIRLNYSCELRYGVVVDIAQQVHAGKPVSIDMGWFNTIWQQDANAMVIQSLAQAASPPCILNLTGRETLRVKDVAEQLARSMHAAVKLTGREAGTALLNDSRRAHELFGPPRVSAEQLIEWVADWTERGGASLDKPTHFESRDGRF